MIVLKHLKEGDVSYVSHKDILRVLQRGLKRARVDVKYSQGFVPHMLTYTSTPVPLGVRSTAEYFVFDCSDKDTDDVLRRYNAAMPEGMRATAAYYCDKNPNVAGIVVASDYVAICAEVLDKEIEGICGRDSYVIETLKKGEKVQKDIARLVYGLRVEGNTLYMCLASGNDNLRADSFIEHINEKFGCKIKINDIVRTAQLAMKDGKMTDVEEILR